MSVLTYEGALRSMLEQNIPRHVAEREARKLAPADPATAERDARVAEKASDGMNKTERRRSVELEALRRAGEIKSWAFGTVTLKLANDCRYTPDFLVEHIDGDGRLVFEEIKGGFIREDSWIKCKVAARTYPMFRFTLRQWKDGRWHVKEVPR